MIRRPPRSTLFPTRRSSDLMAQLVRGDFGESFAYQEPALRVVMRRLPATLELAILATLVANLIARSAEHTSELPPRQYLVCRLPLGKKTKISPSSSVSVSPI